MLMGGKVIIKYCHGFYPVKSPDKSGDITEYVPQTNNYKKV